jgi:hypothetical protein
MIALLTVCGATTGLASLVINITEQGSDLLVEIAGGLNIDAFNGAGFADNSNLMHMNAGRAQLGSFELSDVRTDATYFDAWPMSRYSVFGMGGDQSVTGQWLPCTGMIPLTSGAPVRHGFVIEAVPALEMGDATLTVDRGLTGYVAWPGLASSTVTGKSFADYGLDGKAGTYTTTVNNGGVTDTVTFNVGVIPEPASALFLLVGLGACLIGRRFSSRTETPAPPSA